MGSVRLTPIVCIKIAYTDVRLPQRMWSIPTEDLRHAILSKVLLEIERK